tara:strand:+ start:4356 stop:4739 length:384 start_codon:yes stop_codon:yes gene_type:complete
MPISNKPKVDAEPKVVSEEEYRKKMEAEIRAELQTEMASKTAKNPIASEKGKPNGKKTTSSGKGRHQFSLRLQPEMFSRLSQSADAESRSITNLIITYLELVQHIPTWELRQILDNSNGSRSRRKRR